jgi:hypothetical protein
MIEAFAFLAGRVHLKIDDEFPRSPNPFLTSSTRITWRLSHRCRWFNFRSTGTRRSLPPDTLLTGAPFCTRAQFRNPLPFSHLLSRDTVAH